MIFGSIIQSRPRYEANSRVVFVIFSPLSGGGMSQSNANDDGDDPERDGEDNF